MNEFIARNGLISQNNSEVTGSLLVTNKIGIGVTTPTVTLDVSGNINAVGTVYTQTIQPLSDGTNKAINIRLRLNNNNSELPTLTISSNTAEYGGGGGNIDIVGGYNDYVGGAISWKNGANTKAQISYYAYLRTLYITSEEKITLSTNNTEKLRVDTSGNVGIGTTTPNAKLDVNGNAIISGSLTATAGITGSLFGSSSYALTASYAENAGGGGTSLGLVQVFSVGLQNIF